MISQRVASAFGLGAVLFAGAVPLVAAALDPTYDPCSQFISELGETGAPQALLVNLAGFLPTGLLTILFAACTAARAGANPRARFGFLLFSSVGWAYFVTALFPCDPGCPASGSIAQTVHNAFGVVEYLGGGLGLLLLWSALPREATSFGLGPLSLACALAVLLAFAGMLTPELQTVRGLVQRCAEVPLFLWVLAASLHGWRFGSSAA